MMKLSFHGQSTVYFESNGKKLLSILLFQVMTSVT